MLDLGPTVHTKNFIRTYLASSLQVQLGRRERVFDFSGNGSGVRAGVSYSFEAEFTCPYQ